MHLKLSIQKHSKQSMAVKDITLIAMMVAIIEVCKVTLSMIGNVELTSFWIIMFTLYFGKRIFYAILIFILIEGAIYGFGLWWVMYLYTWPLLAIVVLLLRKMNTAWEWSIVSGVFGLVFGALCAIPYVVAGGLYAGFTWWVAGIPWDLIHGIANFAIMMVLYRPIRTIMERTTNMLFNT